MLYTMQPPRSLSRFPSFKPLSSLSSQPITHPSLTDHPNPTSQILTARQSLLSRQLTAVQLAECFLARLRRFEPHVRSFLHVCPDDDVLRRARLLDDKLLRNEDVGPLAGVFVGVKDNICTSDMPSTGGSRVLRGYRPPFDATAVRKIKDLGGIVVGKTNLDEFGMGSTTEASAFQVRTLLFRVVLFCAIHCCFALILVENALKKKRAKPWK